MCVNYVICKPIYREKLWDQQNNDIRGVRVRTGDAETGWPDRGPGALPGGQGICRSSLGVQSIARGQMQIWMFSGGEES